MAADPPGTSGETGIVSEQAIYDNRFDPTINKKVVVQVEIRELPPLRQISMPA
jgi:hypothetical protein